MEQFVTVSENSAYMGIFLTVFHYFRERDKIREMFLFLINCSVISRPVVPWSSADDTTQV